MLVYKNMTREYKLGAGRVLMNKKNGDVYNIKIFKMVSEFRSIKFPLSRWSTFTRALIEIDNVVSELQINQHLKNTYYIGGGFNVFVTVGFLCVDIR